MIRLSFILLLLLFAPAIAAAQPTEVVQLPAGALRGEQSGAVEAFLGVPFAVPPTGRERWRAPVPAARWHGVRQASAHHAGCAAPPSGDGLGSLNEDCLYLDIYRPAGTGAGDALPVQVFLHGGGNMWGSPDIYDGARFAARARAIVVVPAYRTGIFGFLALDGAGAPDGTLAMRDQIAALKWVRRNIGAMGGDADRVTLAGESAGAADVCGLLTAHAARGLFSRVIMQSGFCHVTMPLGDAQAMGRLVAEDVGCIGRAALSCLRASDAGRLQAAWSKLWNERSHGSAMPLFAVTPSGSALIDEPPMTALERGTFAHVPALVMFDRDELRSMMSGLADKDATVLDGVIDRAYGPAAASVRREYAAAFGHGAFDAIAALRSDHGVICGSVAAADLLSAYVPVAVAEFADRTAPSFRSLGPPISRPVGFRTGAAHTVELQYLMGYRAADTGLSDEQAALADRMIDLWAHFMTAGVTGPWQPYTSAKRAILRIADTADGGIAYRDDIAAEHHCPFWHAFPGAVERLVP